MIRKILSSKRGEMYVEAVVTIIIVMAVLLFCISALQVASVKNQADAIADTLLEHAAFYGCFDSNFYALVSEQKDAYPGIPFEVSISGDWFNEPLKRVQLGDTMTVRVSFSVTIGGFGSFIKIPLTTTRNGASENYWKTA